MKPLYRFRTTAGKTILRRFDFRELERCRLFGTRFNIDGRECTLVVENTQPQSRRKTAAQWPCPSHSLSCHPSQVEEFRKNAKEHGISGVEIGPDGTVSCSSQKAQREYLKLRGLVNNDDYMM